MRLIDADAFRRELDNHWPFTRDEQSKHGIADVAKSVVLIVLNKMPTIEERKTGRWIEVHGFCTPGGDPVWACSECGKGIHVYGIEHGTYGADVSDGQWKACPNCGAKMEG